MRTGLGSATLPYYLINNVFLIDQINWILVRAEKSPQMKTKEHYFGRQVKHWIDKK